MKMDLNADELFAEMSRRLFKDNMFIQPLAHIIDLILVKDLLT